MLLSFTTSSRSQKPRGRHEGSLTRRLRGGLSPDLKAQWVKESLSQGSAFSCGPRPLGVWGAAMSGPPRGLPLLGRCERCCVGEGARCLLTADFHTESGLVHVVTFSKLNQCFKTRQASDKTLDFQLLVKLQFLPGSQGHVPLGVSHSLELSAPSPAAGSAALSELGGGAWTGLNLRRKPLACGCESRLAVTRNSSPGV